MVDWHIYERVLDTLHEAEKSRIQLINTLVKQISELALQLPFMEFSESMGNHDSKIVGADSVD
jgi:hypothetical protein